MARSREPAGPPCRSPRRRAAHLVTDERAPCTGRLSAFGGNAPREGRRGNPARLSAQDEGVPALSGGKRRLKEQLRHLRRLARASLTTQHRHLMVGHRGLERFRQLANGQRGAQLGRGETNLGGSPPLVRQLKPCTVGRRFGSAPVRMLALRLLFLGQCRHHRLLLFLARALAHARRVGALLIRRPAAFPLLDVARTVAGCACGSRGGLGGFAELVALGAGELPWLDRSGDERLDKTLARQ